MTGTQLGVDIGGTKMLVVARDDAGALVDEMEVGTGVDASPEDLERAVVSFVAALDRAPRRVAVAVSGLVGRDGRVVTSDVLPNLAGWAPFAGEGFDAFVVNDVRAALAYAVRTGGVHHVLCVVVGTAVGAAFTGSSGEVFGGADGWAGELGYMPVPDGDGRWHTLDTAAGGAAILRALGMTAAEVRTGLAAADPAVTERVATAGAMLGRGLACAISLLNPRVVFLGGGACRFPGYADAALRTARLSCLPASWAATRIERFRDDRRFVADGAIAASRCGYEDGGRTR